MWRERLGACCFVGSILFDFSTGTGRGFLRAIEANAI